MHLITDGIIVREKNSGENDKFITALTRKYGLISAFCRGSRRIKNKNASATGLFCYGDLAFYKGKDTYTLDEAGAKEVFFNLRCDIVKLSLAQYFCEVILNLAPEGFEADEYLRLMLNSLHYIIKEDRNINLIKAVFELRMLTLSGYMPDLTACHVCGEDEADIMNFNLTDGTLSCPNCNAQSLGSLQMNRTIIATMRYIAYSDFEQLFRFSLPEAAITDLSRVTESFLLEQTERGYKTLDFYHSL